MQNNGYKTLHTEVLNRNDISWKAKGIMAFLLTQEEGFEVSTEEMIENSTEGRSAFLSGMKELENAGYITRVPIRHKGTIVQWKTMIRESVKNNTIDGASDWHLEG